MTSSKKYSVVFFIVLCTVTFYLLSPFTFDSWHPILHQSEKLHLSVYFAFGLLTFLIVKSFFTKEKYHLSGLDLLLFGYVFYLITHTIIIKPTQQEFIYIIEKILLVSLYISFRSVQKKWLVYLFCIVVIASFSHIIYGISKQTMWFAPGFGLSEIKGGFINKAPFACAIACSWFILLVFLEKFNSKSTKSIKWAVNIINVIFLILLFIVIIYSNSRATWVASIATLMFFFFTKITGTSKIKICKRKRWVNQLFRLTLLVTLIFSFNSLYQYKKDSANGRLLIWKICKNMALDNPLVGHGVNTFQTNYMDYQGLYFKQNPNDINAYLASDNLYAFNEILRIMIEEGLAGILVIFFFCLIFIKKFSMPKLFRNGNHLVRTSIFGLMIIFIFGLFSYPTEILYLKILIILFLSILSSYMPKLLKLSSNETFKKSYLIVSKIFVLFLFAILISFSWIKTNDYYRTYKSWNNSLFELSKGNHLNYLLFCNKEYSKLKKNGVFLALYGKSLTSTGEFKKAIAILEQAIQFAPSSTVYIDLGKSYQGLGNYKKAEECWLKASNMVPSQFNPKFLIAKMYQNIGQTDKAKKIAADLLNNKKIKVYSIEVYHILEELKKIAEKP